MIRSIVFPRKLGNSLDTLQPAIALLKALGFAAGNEWHEGGAHGLEMVAPRGGVELIAAPDEPSVDAMVEVSDADLSYEIARRQADAVIRKGIGDTPYGARLFEVEVSGLRLGFVTYAKKTTGRDREGDLDARGKRFALVVARFNSFITERLLDGALLALRQCGADPVHLDVVRVPGSFEIPGAARELAESKRYAAIVCLGCLLRGDTAHYDVIANEVTRGIGQSAQETAVPHGFGVLTCDTLEQAIDRAGLKSGNKGYEAAMAAVEMTCLREKMAGRAGNAAEGGR
jgi:6,7-dimethyl-8-ribityllumazine synthase